MKGRPLGGRRRREWMVMAATIVPSLVAAEISVAAASASTEKGVISALSDSHQTRTNKNKPPRRQRYHKKRQLRIENYEYRYQHHPDELALQKQEEEKAQQRQLQDAGCTFCYDGSSVPNPESASTTVPDWTCGTIETFVGNSLAQGQVECIEFQITGASDCGCPTSPLDTDYCALCDQGDGTVQLIPDSFLELPIPVTDAQPTAGLTCEDLVFVKTNGGVFPCDKLGTYKRYCGCPSATPFDPPTRPPPAAATTQPTVPTSNAATQSPSIASAKTVFPVNDPPSVAPQTPAPTILVTPAPTSLSTPPDEEFESMVPVTPVTGPPTRGGVGETNSFECNMCPDRNPPQYQDRILPYLSPAPTPRSNKIPNNASPPGGINTCGVLAAEAATVDTAALCYAYIYPQVPLDLQSYCGCASGQAWDLCGLCLEGEPLANPDLAVPGTGGLTCTELQEYTRYITDADSCNMIAESARQVCCSPLPDCPVCVNPVFDYNEDKLYPPLGLKCSELSLAQTLVVNNVDENPLTCPEIQERFGWYCECPNAIAPSCSLCGEDLPDPMLPIPALGPGITCGEVNDYASLRTEDLCELELSIWNIDTQAYCGCPGFEARSDCNLQCPFDLVLNRNALVPDSATGIALNSYLTCGDLADTAPFVTDPGLCAAMQESLQGCCMPEGTVSADETQAAASRLSRGEVDHAGFVAYPFLGSVGQSSSSSSSSSSSGGNFTVQADYKEEVYVREFITSPYGSSSRYNIPSSASRTIGSLAMHFLAAVLVYTAGGILN